MHSGAGTAVQQQEAGWQWRIWKAGVGKHMHALQGETGSLHSSRREAGQGELTKNAETDLRTVGMRLEVQRDAAHQLATNWLPEEHVLGQPPLPAGLQHHHEFAQCCLLESHES